MTPRREPGILVVDAGERSALAACESLARAGYRVATAASQWAAPAGWSRFSERRFPLPSPRAAPLEFAGEVARVAAEHGYRAVLPCSEGSLWAISSHREAFAAGEVRLGLPPTETVDRCTDKAELVAAALEAGLGAPETVVCQSRDAALAAAERFGFPAVLKPMRTVFTESGEVRHLASALVGDRQELEAGISRSGLPCLLQRRESGKIVSIAGVFADGHLMGSACSRYLRTWPPEAGPVSFSRTFDPEQSLLDSTASLVRSLGWEGIFELEAIERSAGDYAVLDFNPRIYGSLALAVKAGAPLPAVWCDWLLKERSADARARGGVYYRWEDADLRNAVHRLRGGRVGEALAVMRPRRAVAHAYWRWYDPLPLAVRSLRPVNRLRRLRGGG